MRLVLLLFVLLGLAFSHSPCVADEPQVGKQTAAHFTKEIPVTTHYLLFLPKEYQDSDEKFPLILFLHGAGERGDDLEKVKVHGPPKIVAQKPDFPFIVVSPQSPSFGWNVEVLNFLLDELLDKYRVEPDRVYLTGLSMGGYGTFALAQAHPGRFAAIVPICGGGDPARADRIKDVPMWVFHGAKDEAVPLARSQEMVDAVKAAGGNPKFTIYPDAGHDSWTETYNNDELYRWLLQQRRGGAANAE